VVSWEWQQQQIKRESRLSRTWFIFVCMMTVVLRMAHEVLKKFDLGYSVRRFFTGFVKAALTA
jgi:hypothetical protein